jgi:transposase InsO family protein
MAWEVCTKVSRREEFVRFAAAGQSSLSELCLRYGVSRVTGYKWLQRARLGENLTDRSRRPRTSPARTSEVTEALVCELRLRHPAWGGRKLHHYLRREGVTPLPAPSTVNTILSRNGLLSPVRRMQRDWQRFEAEAPNHLWQMDFKGPIETEAGACHALTVLDDCSRFNLCLAICPDQRRETVQSQLVQAFRCYGLPDSILCDNGPPWGSHQDGVRRFTSLAAWLMRQRIIVSHGRPAHPQTQGKDERFHGSFGRELLASRPVWHSPRQLSLAAQDWRELYNWRRPHEALANEPPCSRYHTSSRSYSEVPASVEYPAADDVRRVAQGGLISFHGRKYRVGRAFTGEPVALRAVSDGVWDVYYCLQRITTLDLRLPPDL